MNTQIQPDYFAGFDWAKTHHDIVVIDASGALLAEFRFEHNAEGWKACGEKLAAFGSLRIAMESGHVDAAERLMKMGHQVYMVNPKSSKTYRVRVRPSGSKSDRGDCLALARAIRFEGESWTPWEMPDAVTQQLRLLCRDEIALIGQRTSLVNQLIKSLYDYYPAALTAFDDWTQQVAWAFVERFPTPETLVQAGKRKWQIFLYLHRCRRDDCNQRRFETFARAQQFQGSDETIAAKSTQALALIKVLQCLESQLKHYREQITECFQKHPDHAIFASLPGAGEKLAPRLLSELMVMPACARDWQWLQSQAGMAPVSYQSGQVQVVHLRRQCNRTLQHTVHLWADQSRHRCEWARVYYQAHRAKGHSHACAIRCLGMRWLKIVSAMVRNHTSYDPQLHNRNQLRHGSWVLTMKSDKAAAA